MIVKNTTLTRSSFHVQRKTVILEPGQSVEVTRMTEPELAFAMKSGHFSFVGSVDTFRYKNFRDIEEKGAVSFGVEEVKQEVEPEVPFEPETEADETVSTEEAEGDAPEESGEAAPTVGEEKFAWLMSGKFPLNQLRSMARGEGLSSAGSKEDIAKRLAGLTVDGE